MGKYEDVLERIKLFNKEYRSIIEDIKSKYPILKKQSLITLGLDDKIGRESTLITKIINTDKDYYIIQGLNYFSQTVISTPRVNEMDEGWSSVDDPHHEPTEYKVLKSIFDENVDLNRIAKDEIYSKIKNNINKEIDYESKRISEAMYNIDNLNIILNNLE